MKNNVKRMDWLNEVKDVLIELRGQGTLNEIYQKVEVRNKIDLSTFTDWKAQIRKYIYLHSSDCHIFKGEVNDASDIFYSIEGKGRGIWGIRNYESFENREELIEEDLGFIEGKQKLREHILRERNPKLIKLAKERFKRENAGNLYCEVCGFDFYEKYGELGEGYIEGHHIIPVSELEEGQETKIQDIVMVCSNCHRMLHRKRPWLTKEQLQNLLRV